MWRKCLQPPVQRRLKVWVLRRLRREGYVIEIRKLISEPIFLPQGELNEEVAISDCFYYCAHICTGSYPLQNLNRRVLRLGSQDIEKLFIYFASESEVRQSPLLGFEMGFCRKSCVFARQLSFDADSTLWPLTRTLGPWISLFSHYYNTSLC